MRAGGIHISNSNDVRRERIALPVMSPGTERSLGVLRKVAGEKSLPDRQTGALLTD